MQKLFQSICIWSRNPVLSRNCQEIKRRLRKIKKINNKEQKKSHALILGEKKKIILVRPSKRTESHVNYNLKDSFYIIVLLTFLKTDKPVSQGKYKCGILDRMKRIGTILKFVLNSLQFHAFKANSNVFLQSIQSPEGCEELSLLDSSSVIEIAMAIVEAAMEII